MVIFSKNPINFKEIFRQFVRGLRVVMVCECVPVSLPHHVVKTRALEAEKSAEGGGS